MEGIMFSCGALLGFLLGCTVGILVSHLTIFDCRPSNTVAEVGVMKPYLDENNEQQFRR